jgi:hypothetical protein
MIGEGLCEIKLITPNLNKIGRINRSSIFKISRRPGRYFLVDHQPVFYSGWISAKAGHQMFPDKFTESRNLALFPEIVRKLISTVCRSYLPVLTIKIRYITKKNHCPAGMMREIIFLICEPEPRFCPVTLVNFPIFRSINHPSWQN